MTWSVKGIVRDLAIHMIPILAKDFQNFGKLPSEWKYCPSGFDLMLLVDQWSGHRGSVVGGILAVGFLYYGKLYNVCFSG